MIHNSVHNKSTYTHLICDWSSHTTANTTPCCDSTYMAPLCLHSDVAQTPACSVFKSACIRLHEMAACPQGPAALMPTPGKRMQAEIKVLKCPYDWHMTRISRAQTAWGAVVAFGCFAFGSLSRSLLRRSLLRQHSMRAQGVRAECRKSPFASPYT